jgi:hypothetical protein
LSIRLSNIDDVVLLTDRLVLALLRLSDAREMHAVLASPELYRFTGGGHPPVSNSRSVTGVRSLDRMTPT